MEKIAKLHIAQFLALFVTFIEAAAISFFGAPKIDSVFFVLTLLFTNLFIAKILFKDECFIELYLDKESDSYYGKSRSTYAFLYPVYKVYIRFALFVDAFCAPLFFVLWIIYEV
ncbi:MAG: hypothetical protein ACI4F6_06055 [Acutalibacteraceae bacterium]